MCNGTFFLAPPPPKGQISLDIIKFQLLNQFQRLLNQTLWVFSQMKDIKHIRRDFHLAAWVMPQGWDLKVTWGGVVRVKKNVFLKFNQISCMSYLHTAPFFGSLPPWEGPKGQIPLNLNYKVTFNDFYTRLCVSSH